MALAALLAGISPAGAVRNKVELSPYAEYVRARAAAAAGMPDVAVSHYRALLDAVPADPVLATRAFREGIIAGDRTLMVRAARLLDSNAALPPDGRVVLMADAVANRDWKAAAMAVDRIEQEDAFGFLVPILRGWIAVATKDGDPLAKMTARQPGGIAAAYIGEHKALILLVMGRKAEALDMIKTQMVSGMRDPRLTLLAARTLMEKRDRANALSLLAGDESAMVSLRQRIEADKPISPGIDDAAQGIAELLIRVAIDINRERVTPLSLSLARSAVLLNPANSETLIETAELLGNMDRSDTALAMVDKVRADDPLIADARNVRIRLLLRTDRANEALDAALKITGGGKVGIEDWTRLGDIYSNMNRQADAATAYARALDAAKADPSSNIQLWSLYLLMGGALEQSEDWPAAKAALEKAVSLAPDQAVALNYLGYAKLEHHEDIDAAQKLIERAIALRPDDAAITDSLGWAYYLKGDLAGAIEKLETAAAGEPAEPSINEHLGDAYWSAGRKLDARFSWRAALVHADKDEAVRLNRKIDFGLQPGELSRPGKISHP